MSQIDPGYFTKETAKAYSNLSTRTLEYAVAQKKLRAFRVGKRVLIAREDLDRFIRQREIGADLDKLVDAVVADLTGK